LTNIIDIYLKLVYSAGCHQEMNFNNLNQTHSPSLVRLAERKEKTMRILIVDDNPVFRETASATLGADHELTFAVNLAEAILQLTSRKSWDGVITDLFFPESSAQEIGTEGELLIEMMRSPQARKREDEHTGRLLLGGDWKSEWEQYAPLGLKVLGLSLKRGIPVVGLSEGDRHENALTFVRQVGYRFGLGDLFSTLYRATKESFSKSVPQTWREAVESLSPGTFLSNFLSLTQCQSEAPEAFTMLTGMRQDVELTVRRWIGYRHPDGEYHPYGLVPEGFGVREVKFPLIPPPIQFGEEIRSLAERIEPRNAFALPHSAPPIDQEALVRNCDGDTLYLENILPVGTVFWNQQHECWSRAGRSSRYDPEGYEKDPGLTFDKSGQAC
jgi:CheY-like chemotaxis protein